MPKPGGVKSPAAAANLNSFLASLWFKRNPLVNVHPEISKMNRTPKHTCLELNEFRFLHIFFIFKVFFKV